MSTPSPPVSISDPFFMVVQAAVNADTYSILNQDNYPSVVYWDHAKYTNNYDNGCGTLQTKSNNDSGKHRFLENMEGVVCSQKLQQEMQEYQLQLWYTLQYYGHAPVTWTKIGSLAADNFFHLTSSPSSTICNGVTAHESQKQLRT
ncbi:hypothetical protein DEU56DRAFT_916668 [Suillus clintonianus]|uniref:uncharacterized protein n=1 Tax=Suillus clintonianus TaxID=1904413 RepID=UPI001B87CB05|nr:uncharacterized protein DEU56DRAFT_916668 [Suillus clintonianus]KAG2125165.1 hypothetical protein DEU56DRAFT_916668 [Suillus clintonianus]